MRNGLVLTTAGLALLLGGAASAETTVRWLHIEQNPQIVEAWEQVAAAFEDKHPGVRIEMQFLENEAFKARLPTVLQSPDRPHIFYSWGGGVFHAQAEAGVLRDITGLMSGEWEATLSPAGVDAFTYRGKVHGAPMLVSQVGFWYNRQLLDQAGVDPNAIGTWDELLAAVQQIKDAGITPIAVGGADKWPLHFYWTLLAVRVGGKEAIDAAVAGQGDGFASETYVRSGELMMQLVELDPFQPGFLSHTYQQAAGHFGDGRAALHLMGNWDYNTAKTQSASGQGIADEDLGWFSFPIVEGGAGAPTDTLGGINGWLISEGAPDEAVEFLRFFLSPEHQREMGARGFFIPVAIGAEADIENPYFKRIAENIAASEYHQVFYDQALGPAVGRVVNDVSADLAARVITPVEAAAIVQDAWEFEHN